MSAASSTQSPSSSFSSSASQAVSSASSNVISGSGATSLLTASPSATSNRAFPTFPSFLPPAPSNTRSSPNSSSGNNSSFNNNTGGAGTLYLYIFLATLLILLCLSGAVLVRSFVLRRRRRQMMEDIWLHTGGTGRPTAPVLGKKPVMYEVHVGNEYEKHMSMEKEWEGWEGVRPFSAQYTDSPSSAAQPAITPPLPTRPPASRLRGGMQLFQRSRSLGSSLNSTSPGDPSPSDASNTGAATDGSKAQVSFLIAMPSPTTSTRMPGASNCFSSAPLAPNSPTQGEGHETIIPYVEFGIAEVLVSQRSGYVAGKTGSEENV